MTTLMRPFFKKGTASSFTVPGAIGETSRLLCIDAGDLAEVLFHLPLVAAIRRRYPGTKIDFLLPEKHAPLVVPSGLARQCVLYRDKQLSPWRPAYGSLLRQLAASDYDVAMVMSFCPRPQLELAALASGASLRLGPSHKSSWPEINFEMRPSAEPDGYLGDRLRGLAPFFGFVEGELRPGWPLPMDKVRQMAQQVHFHKPNPEQLLVGIDPGAGKAGKGLSDDSLLAVARHLIQQFQCRVLPLGDPEQRDRLERFENHLADVRFGLSRETLLEMVLLVSQCDLFIAGNTDFFHLAVALGIPTLGLFSPADETHWIPAGRAHARVHVVKAGKALDFEELIASIREVTRGRVEPPQPVVVAQTPDEEPEPVPEAEEQEDAAPDDPDPAGPSLRHD